MKMKIQHTKAHGVQQKQFSEIYSDEHLHQGKEDLKSIT
jgi:hypothetical protein